MFIVLFMIYQRKPLSKLQEEEKMRRRADGMIIKHCLAVMSQQM